MNDDKGMTKWRVGKSKGDREQEGVRERKGEGERERERERERELQAEVINKVSSNKLNFRPY